MIQDAKTAERITVLTTAQAMCAAARTAPKAHGKDNLYACVLLDDDIERLASELERMGHEQGIGFFLRDAGNLRASQAVVLLGAAYPQYDLNEVCRLCGNENCAQTAAEEEVCVFAPLDLGIAIGSAVSVAADARVDNRVLFSAGKAAVSLGIFDESVKCVMAIPLSVSGKSPYFDRKSGK